MRWWVPENPAKAIGWHGLKEDQVSCWDNVPRLKKADMTGLHQGVSDKHEVLHLGRIAFVHCQGVTTTVERIAYMSRSEVAQNTTNAPLCQDDLG